MTNLPGILVVDDEPRSVEALLRILEDDFEVFTATSARQAEDILAREWIQVLLCDQRMPEMSGIAFCARVREQWPAVVRIIISGYTDSSDIIDAINEGGIYQYITKPWHPEELTLKIKNAVELFQLQRENEQLGIELRLKPDSLEQSVAERRRVLQERFDWDLGIVRGADSVMNQVCFRVRQVAPFDVNVVIQGETGTGKELCARALHYNSLRKNAPFVAENCGAVPDDLLASELFGHKRGAFTGANEDRTGLFEIADGGTIFLDEIGDVSPAFQVKLLRVLQEGEIRPLGSNTRRRVNVRVICATNRDLEQEVAAGRFREDLFYRLANFVIHLPALRHRPGDIEPLAHAILHEQMALLGKSVKGFTREALDQFRQYSWPGNVRELQNEIKRMLVLAQHNELSADLISSKLLLNASADDELVLQELMSVCGHSGTLKDRIEQVEAQILKETLVRLRWNKTRAAEELGLSRVGLRGKLERYGLEKNGAQLVTAESQVNR
ncbi:sigma-54-dependent transcriptional regulator [Shewanella sp. GXUN23E]|uniref:sigma-54-dependent transcriptional regulator n=1 Tax=Shewanella sp. GXUN23E TaxID=3422498 RepID=UPI003D7D34EA